MKVLIVVALICAVAFSAPNKQLKLQNRLITDYPNFCDESISRIVNGNIAEPHSIPYQVFLEFSFLENKWSCGGSLISKNFVLTAAHCTSFSDEEKAQQVKIILGAQNPFSNETSQIILNSTSIIVHEHNLQFLYNDIALIKLPHPVELNENIQLVKIATDENQILDGETGRVSGWGTISFSNTVCLSKELRYIENSILSYKECNEFAFDAEAQICLSGDGPLTVNGIQVGIVSYVSYRDDHLSAYTKVSAYAEWIAKHLK